MRVAMLGDYPLDPRRIGGGVEAVVSYLGAELGRFDDLDLHVVTLRRGLQERRVRGDGRLSVHYLPASYRFANVTFFAANRLRLARELAAIRPDLVHAHIAGVYAQAAYASGRPAVLTPHGIRSRESRLKRGWLGRLLRYPLVAWAEKRSVRRARHLIAISPYVQEAFAGLIRARVYPVENPVADAFFQVQNRAESGRALYVGHVGRDKCVHHLIDALPRVRARAPQAHLRLAGSVYEGDTAYWDALQLQVDALGLDGRVRFLGRLDESPLLEEYARCALLVLPSRQETAPMVIQQAMAAGVPVVATRVGGVPYLVQHGQTGLLVEPGDVDGLAQAIAHLLSDGALCRRMGRAARIEAERRFRAAQVARRTREVYYAVLGQAPPPLHPGRNGGEREGQDEGEGQGEEQRYADA